MLFHVSFLLCLCSDAMEIVLYQGNMRCAHSVIDDSSTPSQLTLGYRYLCLLARIASRLMTIHAMELSHRSFMRS